MHISRVFLAVSALLAVPVYGLAQTLDSVDAFPRSVTSSCRGQGVPVDALALSKVDCYDYGLYEVARYAVCQ